MASLWTALTSYSNIFLCPWKSVPYFYPKYHIYPKYWDILIPYLSFNKIWISFISLHFLCLKTWAWWPGPICSKLTMLLVNILLKLWSLTLAYTLIFLLKNVSSFCICKSYSHFFFSKNTCDLDIVLTRTVNILTTDELVMLMMLWTTGPWWLVLLTCKKKVMDLNLLSGENT